MEMVVFMLVFAITGFFVTKSSGVMEVLPFLYLLKWCSVLFLTMLPSVATMWAITVLFDKPMLSVGLNLLLVIPSVLVAATPFRVFYPYSYSGGYLVSCSLHDFTVSGVSKSFSFFPLVPIAVLSFVLGMIVAIKQFGKKEMR